MVEDFFHGRPPLALRPICEGLLHRLHNGPPLLCSWVRGHLAHVCCIVLSDVLEVSEEAAVAQKDGVVANVACRNCVEDGWPHRLVMLPIGRFGLRSQPDDHPIALHEENDGTEAYLEYLSAYCALTSSDC